VTPTERLAPKLTKIKELAQVIMLSADRILPVGTRQEVENEEFRLQFALKTLTDEAREREADLKIKHMEKVVELLKTR